MILLCRLQAQGLLLMADKVFPEICWSLTQKCMMLLDKGCETQKEAILILVLDLLVDFETARKRTVVKYDFCRLRIGFSGFRIELRYPRSQIQAEIKFCLICQIVYFPKFISTLLSFGKVLSEFLISAAL